MRQQKLLKRLITKIYVPCLEKKKEFIITNRLDISRSINRTGFVIIYRNT